MVKPAEMHPGLCKLLRTILQNESEDVDVLDRAGYYYSAQKDNIGSLKAIFAETKETEKILSKQEKTPNVYKFY